MHNHTLDSAHQSENNQNGNNLMCPVMKETPVNKEEAEKAGLVKEYKGKKYYFCCDERLANFDQNPEEYTK